MRKKKNAGAILIRVEPGSVGISGLGPPLRPCQSFLRKPRIDSATEATAVVPLI